MEAVRSCRYDVQPFQSLEMHAIVAEQREIVSQRGCANENVHVGDEISRGSQVTSLTGEYLASVLVQMNDFKACEEVPQGLSFSLRVSRIECTFIEFSNRHDAQTDALRRKLINESNNASPLVHVVD